jgi:hypothetical protein
MKKFLLNTFNKHRWFEIYLFTFQRYNINKIFIPLYLFNFLNFFFVFFFNFFYKNFIVKFFYFINICSSLKKKNLKNKTCFLVGNGPSLTQKDLLKVNNENKDIFVCNNFLLVNRVTKINIKYNVLCDVGYINDLKKRKKRSWLYKMSQVKKQPEVYCFPHYFQKNLKKNISFKNSEIKYFKELPYPTEEYVPNYFDLKTGIPWSYNVSVSMINLAIAIGYNRINLIGFDTSFHLNEDYYEGKKYNKVSNRKKNTSKYRLIRSSSNLLGMWSTYRFLKSHENIKFYCKKNNIIIKNLSNSGILDVYDE